MPAPDLDLNDAVAARQLAELRTQFSTELERAREQVAIAQERAEARLVCFHKPVEPMDTAAGQI